MSDTWLAVLLALGSALSQAYGAVMRHRTAEGSGPGVGGTVSALSEPLWWAGTLVSLLGFVLQGAALSYGSLLLVQPVTVLSLLFALPLGAHVTGRRVTVAEWLWGSLLTVCIGVIVVVGRPVGGEQHPPAWEWFVATAAGVAVMALLMWLGRGPFVKDKALLTGVAGGTAFAYVALFTKGVVDRWAAGGFGELLVTGELYGLVVAGVTALVVQQASFKAGAVYQAVPASTVTTPVVSIALGLALLDERFTTTPVEFDVLLGALAVMVLATVQLSRTDVAAASEHS